MLDNVTFGQLSALVISVVAIWKALDFLIEKWTKPFKTMQEQMDFSFRIMYSMLQHEVTGNHVNDMEKLLNETTQYIIKRGNK